LNRVQPRFQTGTKRQRPTGSKHQKQEYKQRRAATDINGTRSHRIAASTQAEFSHAPALQLRQNDCGQQRCQQNLCVSADCRPGETMQMRQGEGGNSADAHQQRIEDSSKKNKSARRRASGSPSAPDFKDRHAATSQQTMMAFASFKRAC